MTIADIAIQETLAAAEKEAEAVASELYTEKLVPILRQVSGYRGDFTIAATSKMTLSEETNLIDNRMTLALKFPNPAYNDGFELAQRFILTESFRLAISRHL